MLYNYNARVLRCVDADTLDVQISLGLDVYVNERVRLLGVNCPETFGRKVDSDEYRAGKKAQAWLIQQLCHGMTDDEAIDLALNTKGDMRGQVVGHVRIVTTKDKRGKYGRYLATLYVGDDTESINTKLILMGFGAEY